MLDETALGNNKAAMSNQNKPDPVRSDLLEKAKAQGIRHGYFTRIGGISNGIYRGLNTGIG